MDTTAKALQHQVQKILKELGLHQKIATDLFHTTDITTYNPCIDIDIRENKPAGKQGHLICYTRLRQENFTLINTLTLKSPIPQITATHPYNYEDPQSIDKWEKQLKHTLQQWQKTSPHHTITSFETNTQNTITNHALDKQLTTKKQHRKIEIRDRTTNTRICHTSIHTNHINFTTNMTNPPQKHKLHPKDPNLHTTWQDLLNHTLQLWITRKP